MKQLAFPLNDTEPLADIRSRLLPSFGPQRALYRLDPVSQLVRAMLSSRTKDNVSAAAFARMQERYESWDLLRSADPKEIKAIIHTVTHADVKALYLPQAMRAIVARHGALNLNFLADWDDEEAMRLLVLLPGVGPKIAAAVLNFSTLHKRALVVDTHLLRIGKRLGLLPRHADYEDGYETYMSLVPDSWDADDLFELHWLLKYHGQKTCPKLSPDCPNCPLRDLCRRCPNDEMEADDIG